MNIPLWLKILNHSENIYFAEVRVKRLIEKRRQPMMVIWGILIPELNIR